MNSAGEANADDAIHAFADRAIREMLADSANLRGLLRRVVREAADRFDYAKKRILPRDFLLPNWKGRERDFLCEIPYRLAEGERQALVCVLIEHQTQPNSRMPLRTLIYTVFYWEQCLRAWESAASPRGAFRLPTVVPIVLHASPRRWTGPRTLAELLDEPTAFHPFAPKWEPLFWEVGEHSPEDLLHSDDAFLQVLSIVRVEDAERDEALRVYREMLQKVAGLHERDSLRWTHLLRFALGWVVNRRPPVERHDWLQATEDSQTSLLAKEEIRNMGKTIAQSWVDEGIEIGQAKGIEIGQAKGIEIGQAKGIEIGQAKGIEIGQAKGIEIGQAKGIEIGQANTLRSLIVEFGAKRLGTPNVAIQSALQSISDIARLDLLVHKVLDVSSWNALFQEET